MAGLLGEIFSAGNVAKRKLTDLLGNPVLSAQQMLGNLNDRARVLNQMTAAAAKEGIAEYGPETRKLAGLLADAYNPAGITVWHGSPHKFSKFDASKIGTGEGAQAYGHGLYVAESPAVAKEYSKLDPAGGMIQSPIRTVFGKEVEPGTGQYKAASLLDSMTLPQARKMVKGWVANARPEEAAYFNDVADTLASITKKSDVKQMAPGGNLYKIDLPDEHIAKMLDFDKPLMQQSKEIQNLAKQYGLTDADHLGGDLIAAMDAKRAAGAEMMRQAGVPGIRYLDQGSRGTGQGTSNFVVFPGNEDILRILERNGGILGP